MNSALLAVGVVAGALAACWGMIMMLTVRVSDASGIEAERISTHACQIAAIAITAVVICSGIAVWRFFSG